MLVGGLHGILVSKLHFWEYESYAHFMSTPVQSNYLTLFRDPTRECPPYSVVCFH